MADSVEQTFHVADATEVMQLLPKTVVQHIQNVSYMSRYEPVFMVCDQSNTIENGTMVDTVHSKYFSFEIMLDAAGNFDVIPTSDWLPCSEE